MEYIHKAKAEKNRTKVLSDQMEARRAKNKVCLPNFVSCLLVYPLSRALVSVVQPDWLRSARASLRLNNRRQPKSRHDVAFIFFCRITMPFFPTPHDFSLFQAQLMFGYLHSD